MLDIHPSRGHEVRQGHHCCSICIAYLLCGSFFFLALGAVLRVQVPLFTKRKTFIYTFEWMSVFFDYIFLVSSPTNNYVINAIRLRSLPSTQFLSIVLAWQNKKRLKVRQHPRSGRRRVRHEYVDQKRYRSKSITAFFRKLTVLAAILSSGARMTVRQLLGLHCGFRHRTLPRQYATRCSLAPYRGRGAEHRKTPLLSAYGPALHGFHRGPRASFAEPVDAWLSVLADSVPFVKDCLVVCPSSMSDSQMERLLRRCRAHLPSAHLSRMERQWETSATTARGAGASGASMQSGESGTENVGSRPSVRSLSSTSLATGRRERLCSAALPAPTSLPPSRRLISPLEKVTADALDIVIFVGDVFGDEMLLDCPWHLSLAHRALRRHGVVVLMGSSPLILPTAPYFAAEDTSMYYDMLQKEAESRLLCSPTAPSSSGCSYFASRRIDHLRSAVETEASRRTGHADTFLPFPSIRRRWFASEFALYPSELIDAIRATPIYQALYAAGGAAPCRTPPVEQDDFIHVEMPELFPASGEAANMAASPPSFVRRRHDPLDPLEVLQRSMELQLAAANDRSVQPFPHAFPDRGEAPLRVVVQHFVVSCSYRGVNMVQGGWEDGNLLLTSSS